MKKIYHPREAARKPCCVYLSDSVSYTQDITARTPYLAWHYGYGYNSFQTGAEPSSLQDKKLRHPGVSGWGLEKEIFGVYFRDDLESLLYVDCVLF